jgi:hypothetical protein
MERHEEKLPEGWAYYHAAKDFITPWGPRYVAGQTIKLSADQAEQLADKNVLEEGPGEGAVELSNMRAKSRADHLQTEERNLKKTHPEAVPVQETRAAGASGPTSKKDDDDDKRKGKK